MKNIFYAFLLVSTTIFAQKKDDSWKKVYQFEYDGKIKSASDEVDKIYKKAHRQGNQQEIIKTFFYQSKFMQTLTEEAQYKIIENLKQELQTKNVATKAIFEFIYGKLLQDYFNDNRYNLKQQATTETVFNPDFRTWSETDFEKEIKKAFDNSIENETVLMQTLLKNYESIIDYSKYDQDLNRTLFDFLVQNYIENKNNYEATANLSGENLTFLNENIRSFYGETSDFIKLNLTNFETIPSFKTLSLYQKIEKNYSENKNDLALSNTIFKRIQAVNNNRNQPEEYLSALNQFSKNTNNRLKNRFLLEQATIYQNNASKEKNKDYLQKAIAICDNIIPKNEAPFANEAKQIKQQILQKQLEITTEKYLIPNQPNRAFVNFKDVDTIYATFYKLPQKLFHDNQNNYRYQNGKYQNIDSLYIAFANKHKAYKTFTAILPNKQNHFQYSTEIVLPEVETGSYLLVLNTKKDGLNVESTFAYATIQATEMTLLADMENIQKSKVYHRKTGKPIADVKINTYNTNNDNYNYYKTVEVIHEKDTLSANYYNYHRDNYHYTNEGNAKVKLYTDRAIYRPGQKVFFKGILLQIKNQKTKTIANEYVSIVAEDENGEEIFETKLKTNEYGSFAGDFDIPKGGLTGTFSLEAEEFKDPYNDLKFWDSVNDFENSQINFQVEEYKRPKFEIKFEDIKDNFIVNQNIKIKGKAKSYAGSNISDAKVIYSVQRNSQYNNWWYYRQANNYDDTEIAHGETKTDADGNFEIEFKAIPAEGYDEKGLPIFKYTINAEITDINGETRSNKTVANVGYHSLILTANVPRNVNARNQQKIILNSQNLNNQFVKTDAEIKIFKLKAPNRVLKDRLWTAPELQTIAENDFIKWFPSEPYKDENNIEKWEKGEMVFNQKVNTEATKEIILSDLKKWISGEYQLFFTAKDAFGKDIETIARFQLTNDADTKLADNQLFHFEILNENPKKDGFVKLKFSSATDNLFVATEAYHESKIIFNQVVSVENGLKIITIPADKNWKNDIKVVMNYVWENKNFSAETAVNLPEIKETMAIETISLRNKIDPGSGQSWSFVVKDQNKKPAAAEALATMYDASLDQFVDRKWDTNLDFQNYRYNDVQNKQALGFGNANYYFKNLNKNETFESYFEADKINWFGFSFMYPQQYEAEYRNFLTEQLLKLSSEKISGIVTENGLPLPGVNVVVVGSKRGVQTDFDGRYSIEAFIGEVLNFSFIGFNDKVIEIRKKIIDVDMRSSNDSSLQEVVVVGYGKTTKESLVSSAVSSIKYKEISDMDGVYDKVLSGKVAGITIRGAASIEGQSESLIVIDGVISTSTNMRALKPEEILSLNVLKGSEATALYGVQGKNGVVIITTKKSLEALTQVKARKNLSETAFFFPQLQTDEKGNLKFSFTSPEALTQWKLRLLAHNKKGVSAYLENSIITQKELMLMPNMPRFLREKDSITITAKIANMTTEAKTGIAMLQLFDATTMQPIDAKMLNANNIKNFNIKANGNSIVSWKIYVPEALQGIQYKIMAKAGNFTDGEENILPVLTNSMLVTESLPIWVRGNTKKEYTFENFKNNTSTTLRNHLLTLEYTSNPAWYAIKSLPYLMEYEHECAEQTFARYYANVLANEIVTSNPKIATVFEAWRKSGKPFSKLEQNEELKSLIIAETPWVRDAENEENQKKNLALLFDLEKMKSNINENFEKLDKKQSDNGGFPWFAGGYESGYITRHIVTGLGHLDKLKITNQNTEKFKRITNKAVPFLDAKFMDNQRRIDLLKKQKVSWYYDNYSDLHYLYARSFYIEKNPIGDSLQKRIQKHIDYTKTNWLKYDLYQKAMATLVLNRFNESETAQKILVNLKETAVNNEENGMYWINNKSGWYWYQAPVETQALLIEAFAEVGKDEKSVEDMKVWLLKNRETKSWKTTKATTEAVYALLMQGKDWLSVKDNTVIKIGDDKVMTKKMAENEKEAGSGYIKLNWKADEIKKDMATVSVNNKSSVTGFGGFYWQYFEELDKIKTSQTSPMTIEKELYLKVNSDKGKELQLITDTKPLKIGDLVTVRLIIYTKEDMDYVHLKDMRASCFEPVDVISTYKYEGNLGYYQSTKDAATHFFFDTIAKGKYFLEYDIRVNNAGDFSNGITTIESMYTPEFSSHTKGIRVMTKE